MSKELIRSSLKLTLVVLDSRRLWRLSDTRRFELVISSYSQSKNVSYVEKPYRLTKIFRFEREFNGIKIKLTEEDAQIEPGNRRATGADGMTSLRIPSMIKVEIFYNIFG